jgi:hypothetical protein
MRPDAPPSRRGPEADQVLTSRHQQSVVFAVSAPGTWSRYTSSQPVFDNQRIDRNLAGTDCLRLGLGRIGAAHLAGSSAERERSTIQPWLGVVLCAWRDWWDRLRRRDRRQTGVP